jgi:hypothetical protein
VNADLKVQVDLLFAESAMLQHDDAKALDLLHKCLDFYASHGSLRDQAHTFLKLARAHLGQQDLVSANEALKKSLALATLSKTSSIEIQASFELAKLCWMRREDELASKYHETALASLRQKLDSTSAGRLIDEEMFIPHSSVSSS